MTKALLILLMMLYFTIHGIPVGEIPVNCVNRVQRSKRNTGRFDVGSGHLNGGRKLRRRIFSGNPFIRSQVNKYLAATTPVAKNGLRLVSSDRKKRHRSKTGKDGTQRRKSFAQVLGKELQRTTTMLGGADREEYEGAGS